ncbi:MAG: hypothetical protein KDJ75_02985 [Alphaproteobacteria bacterium]|nr:hypothetical protein [Alphaproteobacteria bacterium]
MSVALKKHFLSQNRKGPSKDRLKPLLDRALKTPIGTKLLEDFANSNGMIKAYKKIPKYPARGIYHSDQNIILLAEPATSTDLIHESAHARQDRKVSDSKEIKQIKETKDIISPASAAHLSVIQEADAWALSALYWKEFFSFNPFESMDFLSAEGETFKHLESISLPSSDHRFIERFKKALGEENTSATYLFLKFTALLLWKIGKEGSEDAVDDYLHNNIISQVINPETDMHWAGTTFLNFVLGEGIKGANGYHYTEEMLEAYRKVAAIFWKNSPPVNFELPAFRNISKAEFEMIISTFSDLSDLGRTGESYTEQYQGIGEVFSIFSNPSKNLLDRAEKLEQEMFPKIGRLVYNPSPSTPP